MLCFLLPSSAPAAIVVVDYFLYVRNSRAAAAASTLQHQHRLVGCTTCKTAAERCSREGVGGTAASLTSIFTYLINTFYQKFKSADEKVNNPAAVGSSIAAASPPFSPSTPKCDRCCMLVLELSEKDSQYGSMGYQYLLLL